MKKITSIAVGVAFAALPLFALADTSVPTCGQLDANGHVIVCGNGDPGRIVNVWGLDGYDTPQVPSGSTMHDEAGISFSCPVWYGQGCSDITHTDYYRQSARVLASQLQAGGYALGQYSYWLGH